MAGSSILRSDTGEEALERLRSADPPLFLSPSSELSDSARIASRHLFSSLLPYCPKPPVDALLADESFDAEQIWSQIELLSRPILSSLRREVKRLERVAPLVSVTEVKETDREEVKMDEDEEEDGGDDDDEEDEEEEEEEEEGGGEEKDCGDDDEEEEDEDEKGGEDGSGVEDRFLKIKELEEYLEADEAREYGVHINQGRTKRKEGAYGNDKNKGMDEGEEEGDEDYAEFGDLDSRDDDDEDERYEDFFGEKTERLGKRKGGIKEKVGADGAKDPLLDEESDGMNFDTQNVGTLSTHEKELLKMHSKIQEMEKANLEPKMWTMQGEVTATKRPKNSALEVDLDFEHNVRPPPVITEEVTNWLEDVIKKRIIEGRFDDVQRVPELPSRAPKEFKEMVETKSKKGLAEIYEEEYAEKTGLATAPISSSCEKMKEAEILFKKLCLKLDALSHFHFAPKPVIEEMSIQANIPALAMEEIAPVAVSDAAMLAPEEVFQGKGDVKEEAELSQSDRKRRRHNKKRRFKAEQTKREAKKARQKADRDVPNGKEESYEQ